MDGAALARHAQGALMAMIVRVAVCGSILLEGVAHAFDGRLLLAGVNRIFFAVGFVFFHGASVMFFGLQPWQWTQRAGSNPIARTKTINELNYLQGRQNHHVGLNYSANQLTR
jgi:hypothetical protein